MSRDAKRIVATVFAFLFLTVALVFSFALLTNSSLTSVRPDDEKLEKLGANASREIETIPNNSPLTPVVQTRYLWEYGWQIVSEELPEEEVTEPATEEETTAPEPVTDFEEVTDWRGETVTDEFGQAVTQRMEYFTEFRTELLTDADGNIVFDGNGRPIYRVVEETRPTQAPPVTIQDGHGGVVTQPNGEPVTKVEKSTSYIYGSSAGSAAHWGEGISDGEKIIGVRVVIQDDYSIAENGKMTVNLTYTDNRKLRQKTLEFNIDKRSCTAPNNEYYTDIVKLSKENGNVVVTMYFPESTQIPVDAVKNINAMSNFNTFRDAEGNYPSSFSVYVFT